MKSVDVYSSEELDRLNTVFCVSESMILTDKSDVLTKIFSSFRSLCKIAASAKSIQ